MIFPDNQEITEDIVTYYEKNPAELDLIINKEHFHIAYLGAFFFIGLTLTVAARIMAYFFGQDLGEFVNDVVLDVISEIGIAIFGGAIVAYLIEYLNKKQYQQNVKFRREVIARIEERKRNKK